MTKLVSFNCPSCGASVDCHGVEHLKCEFCGTQLMRAKAPRRSTAWTETINLAPSLKAEIQALLTDLTQDLETEDHEQNLRRADRLVAIAPDHWEGYYHRAHSRFWISITSGRSFGVFFEDLRQIVDDIEKCEQYEDDTSISDGLKEEVFSNMAEIASHQSRHGFTGNNIENVMKMLLVCDSRLPGHPTVARNKERYGTELVKFSTGELRKAEARSGGDVKPPETHLEYLFFSWKYLGVTDGIADYHKYANLFIKNSYDKNYKAVLGENLKEVQDAGLLPKTKKRWFF